MKIYKVSLDDDVPQSMKLYDSIKLVAYLLYDSLLIYEYEYDKKVLYKDGIKKNELYEGYVDLTNQYVFEHTDYHTGLYEPFMLDNTTFGFTVYDDSISDEVILGLLDEVKRMIKSSLNFKLDTVSCKEEKRNKTLKTMFNDASKKHTKTRFSGFRSYFL